MATDDFKGRLALIHTLHVDYMDRGTAVRIKRGTAHFKDPAAAIAARELSRSNEKLIDFMWALTNSENDGEPADQSFARAWKDLLPRYAVIPGDRPATPRRDTSPHHRP